MKKMKILQFPISMNSGVTQYAMNNWKFISKDDFQFDFALVRENAALEAEIRRTGAGVKHIFASADRNREMYIQEVGAVLSEEYDAVHLHTSFWKRLLIEELAVQYQVPKIIVHSHNTFVDVQDAEARIKAEELHFALRKKFDMSLATDFCACSKDAADWLFGDNIPRSRIRILRNAIDVERYLFHAQIRADMRSRLGLDGKFVIGHVGRFSYQKNHEFLVDVFHDVCKEMPHAVLMLIGEGPLEAPIHEKAARLGLSEKILFMGQREDVPDLLQAMDMFCLPSRFEGLGIVLIEAQAAGLPCLISDIMTDEGAITDLVTRLPLEVDPWREYILRSALESSERPNMLEPVTAAGYNIRHQIKELEQMYSE